MTEKQIINQLVKHFGVERLIARLPQQEVVKALKLVTPQELAEELCLSYQELRWQMKTGKIPFPSFTLVRRAYFTSKEAKAIKAKRKRSK